MNEKEAHWSNIKFNAKKWRDAEKLENELRLKIINLQVDMERASKEAKNYAKKTRSLILVEII